MSVECTILRGGSARRGERRAGTPASWRQAGGGGRQPRQHVPRAGWRRQRRWRVCRQLGLGHSLGHSSPAVQAAPWATRAAAAGPTADTLDQLRQLVKVHRRAGRLGGCAIAADRLDFLGSGTGHDCAGLHRGRGAVRRHLGWGSWRRPPRASRTRALPPSQPAYAPEQRRLRHAPTAQPQSRGGRQGPAGTAPTAWVCDGECKGGIGPNTLSGGCRRRR